MSTLKLTNIQHNSAASPAIVLAADNTATLNGLAFPTSGSLSGRNRIINGDMRIDQRNDGAAVTISAAGTATAYVIDRFQFSNTITSGTMTVQRSTVAPAGFSFSALVTNGAAVTAIGSQRAVIWQPIEGFNFADLNYGTANAVTTTVSFWVRSSIAGTYTGSVVNESANRSYVFTYAVNSANTWEQKSVTIPGDTAGTWTGATNGIGAYLFFDLGSGPDRNATAGSWVGSYGTRTSGSTNWIGTNGATFYITGVQLEAGTVATPFERRSYGQELALCQRYCCVFGRSQDYTAIAYGFATGGAVAQAPIFLPVEMRTIPTSITTSGNWQISDGLAPYPVTSFTVPSAGQSSSKQLTIDVNASGGGMAAYRPVRIESANSPSAYIIVATEL